MELKLRAAAAVLALGCAVLAARAPAQVGLPSVRVPQLPATLPTPLAGALGQGAVNESREAAGDARTALRRASAQRLIRNNRQQLEGDPNGEPMLRGQLVGLDLSEAALAGVIAAGFAVIDRQALPGLDSQLFVLRAPPGLSTRRALQRLRELQPQASFDYDHVYAPSAIGASALLPDGEPVSGAVRQAVPGALRVGLIDAGVQRIHAAFASVTTTLWGCGGLSVPSAHGTAVASLLVGDAPPFRGAAPGGALYAADVYCGAATGGAITDIVAALGWMNSQGIAVINVSLVGPDNTVLRQIIQHMVARGHLIVAAVGNDGPAAPPLYPAAYAGVVGVTAVDAKRRVLLEAERGSQVSFAAPGADMAAATLPEGYEIVRGTSFAAPLVAGLLAQRLAEPGLEAAQRAVASLAREAVDLGVQGRDTTFGFGLVAAGVPTAPALVHARPAATP